MKYFVLLSSLGLFLAFGTLFPQQAHALRLFSSGCELQGDTGSEVSMSDYMEWKKELNQSSSAVKITSQVKRSGNSSCKISTSGTSALWHKFDGSESTGTFYIRFYINIESYPSGEVDIGNFLSADGGDALLTLSMKTDGTLALYNQTKTSAGSPDQTSSVAIPQSEWHMVEWMYSDASGSSISSEVRIDGVRVMYTNSINSESVGAFNLGKGYNFSGKSATYYLDDIAFNNASGDYQNSWPGPGSIVHMQPSAPGDFNDCNGQNYSHIDEVTPDDSGTVCALTQNGDTIDVNVESPFNAGIDPAAHISLIQVGVREAAQSGADDGWKLRLKSSAGGTPVESLITTHNDSTHKTNGDNSNNNYDTPGNYLLTSYVDPQGGCSWSQYGTNSLDSMQIGVEATDANPDVLVSTLWALVEYTDGFVEPCASPTAGNLYDPITVAQSKTSIYTQTKEGGLWTKAIAADKLCLGSSSNCITSWSSTPRCRLEHQRVVARPNATNFPAWGLPDFSTNIATNQCDAMLSAASVGAGWVSTGYDYSNRITGGSSAAPRVCYFARLVCDTNVQILPSTATGPLAHPVSGFTQ